MSTSCATATEAHRAARIQSLFMRMSPPWASTRGPNRAKATREVPDGRDGLLRQALALPLAGELFPGALDGEVADHVVEVGTDHGVLARDARAQCLEVDVLAQLFRGHAGFVGRARLRHDRLHHLADVGHVAAVAHHRSV